MAIPIKSRLKKRFKRKKQNEPEIRVDEITKNKLQKLRQQISDTPEKDHSSEFSAIIRFFFMKLLKIRYYFTYEEFVKEMENRRLSPELKSELTEFFKHLSNMEFKQEGYTIEELNQQLQKFENLIPLVLEEKHAIITSTKHGLLSRLLVKLRIKKTATPKPKIKLKKKAPSEGKLNRTITNLKFNLTSALTLKWLRKTPQDKLTFLYSMLAESYEDISNNRIAKAESQLSKIDALYNTLTPIEARQIKKEITQLRKEVNSLKEPEPIEKPITEPTTKPTTQPELDLPPPPPMPGLELEEELSQEMKLVSEEEQPTKKSFLKSLFKPKKHIEEMELPPLMPTPPPPKIDINSLPEMVTPKISEPKVQQSLKPRIKKKPVIPDLEMKKKAPTQFKPEQPELEFYPQQPSKQAKFEKQPTIENIPSLELESIQKGDASFRPKSILVSSYAHEIQTQPNPSEKTTTLISKPKSESTKTELTQPIKKPTSKLQIEDLDNLIQTTQHLINQGNYSSAMDTYSKALQIKKYLRLKSEDSKRISYDLTGIDIDLKLSRLT